MKLPCAASLARLLTGVVAAIFLPIVVLTFSTRPAMAQNEPAGVRVEDNSAQVTFAADIREIRFQLRARSDRADDPIRAIQLLYQVDESPVQNTVVPAYRAGQSVTASYTWRVASVLVPGTDIHFQWQIETASGKRLTTPAQSVAFVDSRFTWREAQGEGLTVYWNGSDGQTASTILAEAKKTLTRLSTEFGLAPERPIRVFAYTRQQDFVSAVTTGSRPVSMAMTFGLDRIFLLAGGETGLTQALPSLRGEVANAVFRQKTANSYAEAPQWLAEGFSMLISDRKLSEQDYQAMGKMAESNRLLPLRRLHGSFPQGDRDRSLAYAQSLSFVQYLYNTYGAPKMNGLFAAFKEGNTVDDAFKKGLGAPLDQVETRWKSALKNGTAARLALKSPGAASAPLEQGDGSFIDTLLGQPVRYWQGVFGANTRMIVFGASGFIALALAGVIGGSFVGLWRKGRAED